MNMNNLRELVEKNRKLCILQLLQEDVDYSLNLGILQTALTSLGHGVSRATLVADAIWLEEARLLTITNKDNQAFMILTLNSRGQDVARGLATYPGIDRVLA